MQPLPDPQLDQDSDPALIVESRDSVRLALIAALQHLSAMQRVVLILRDGLAWQAALVAELLDVTPAAVNGLLQRAPPIHLNVLAACQASYCTAQAVLSSGGDRPAGRGAGIRGRAWIALAGGLVAHEPTPDDEDRCRTRRHDQRPRVIATDVANCPPRSASSASGPRSGPAWE